jgi:MFS family permease
MKMMFTTKNQANNYRCVTCGSSYKEPIEFCEKCGSNQTKEKLIKEQKKVNIFASEQNLNNKLLGQIQILAVLEIAFSLLGLFMAIFAGVASFYIRDIARLSSNSEFDFIGATSLLQVMLLMVGAGLLLGSLVGLVSGYKLYYLNNSGRFGTLVLSSLILIVVPFGTIFGIISLVLLNKPETIELLRERNRYL